MTLSKEIPKVSTSKTRPEITKIKLCQVHKISLLVGKLTLSSNNRGMTRMKSERWSTLIQSKKTKFRCKTIGKIPLTNCVLWKSLHLKWYGCISHSVGKKVSNTHSIYIKGGTLVMRNGHVQFRRNHCFQGSAP